MPGADRGVIPREEHAADASSWRVASSKTVNGVPHQFQEFTMFGRLINLRRTHTARSPAYGRFGVPARTRLAPRSFVPATARAREAPSRQFFSCFRLM
jgi:hypothetical protein